jgi:spermidine synthase
MKRLFSVYVITFVLAAASIMYELIIADTIATLAGSAVVWYSITIGLYLLSLGFGAFYAEGALKRRPYLLTLLYTEILLVILGSTAVLALHVAHMAHVFFLVQGLLPLAAIIFPLVALSYIIAIGFLTGIELPVLIVWANDSTDRNVINRVFAFDYVGDLTGALLVPIVLIPLLSAVHAGFVTALINLVVAVVIVVVFIGARKPLQALGAGLLTSMLAIGFYYAGSIERYFLEKYYFYQGANISLVDYITPYPTPEIVHAASAYQNIDLVTIPESQQRRILNAVYSTKFAADPYYPSGYHLFLDGDFQLLSNTDDIYHEWFAHFPIIATGKVPERVLVLGGGDGLLNKELLKYEQIENITHVELDPEMITLAREHPALSRMNAGSLDNPRVELVMGDAYAFVKYSDETYDAIYIDFPYAQDYNLARLYSKEFYSFVSKRLSDDGYVVFDAPGADLYTHPETEEVIALGKNWHIAQHTLRAAGYTSVYGYASILELFNQEAFDVLDALDYPVVHPDGTPVEGTEEELEQHEHDLIRGALVRYADTSNQPFIMATKYDFTPQDWAESGVTLHVLNELRYNLSKDLPYPTIETIDPRMVNSIMRPVFESGVSWRLRRPY